MYSLKEFFKLQFSPSLLPGIKEIKGELHLRICSMKCLLNKTSSHQHLHQAAGKKGDPCTRLHLTPVALTRGGSQYNSDKNHGSKNTKHTTALRFATKQHCLLPSPQAQLALKHGVMRKLLPVGKEDILRMERSGKVSYEKVLNQSQLTQAFK